MYVFSYHRGHKNVVRTEQKHGVRDEAKRVDVHVQKLNKTDTA